MPSWAIRAHQKIAKRCRRQMVVSSTPGVPHECGSVPGKSDDRGRQAHPLRLLGTIQRQSRCHHRRQRSAQHDLATYESKPSRCLPRGPGSRSDHAPHHASQGKSNPTTIPVGCDQTWVPSRPAAALPNRRRSRVRPTCTAPLLLREDILRLVTGIDYQPRSRHSSRCGRSAPMVASLPCPG